MKKIAKLLYGLLTVGLVFGLAGPLFAMGTACGLLLSIKPQQKERIYVAGISREIWESDITKLFYKSNEFMLRAKDDSEYVNYRTVHLPQSGVDPTVTVNQTYVSTPLAVGQRTDTTVDYSIDELSTSPTRILNAETVELSYNKREDVIMQHTKAVRQTAADLMIYKWGATASSSANILRTTGFANNDVTTTVSANAYLPSATGTRKVFTLYDVRQANVVLNNANVPLEGRCMLMSANAYDQLLTDLVATKYRDFSDLMDAKTGVVNRVLGFDIYIRSSTLRYDNSTTPVKKAQSAAAAATDNDSVLFWQEDQVRRALGDIHMFEDINSAVYQGDVYSVLMRHGGALSRTTELGVGSIVQTP